MKTKLCKKCNIEKNVENFRLKKDKCGKHYRYSYCKQCEKEYATSEISRERKKLVDKKYRKTHKQEINYKAKERYKNMCDEEKQKLRNINKEYYKKYRNIWRKNNKEKIKKYYMKDYKKRKNDSLLHLKDQIRHEILRSFKSKGKPKKNHTEKILGIGIKEFILYLLQTFKDNYGYEWDGIEKVHIDHIIPLATVKTEEDLIKLCYYTNLQLLKAKDNLEKKDKLNWELHS